MLSQWLLMGTLVSIWLSLFFMLVTLGGATHFWLTHANHRAVVGPLKTAPTVTIVVPAHNEEIVIAQTIQAILDLNYPTDKVELLLFADNCSDNTKAVMDRVVAPYQAFGRKITVIDRTGTGGKAGVLNDALKMATGAYLAVYDADAMPEKNALYFLVKKALEDPEKYVAVFGRNKTRNAAQNFLTRCINQEIVVTQRIQHCAIWHMFSIGRIPGTNFIIKKDVIEELGGWENGALTEDTDLSFKLMAAGKLIALAYQSEAFQQEPETLAAYCAQRLRWAKGNYQVVLKNIPYLFKPANWRVKLEVCYYTATFFWFNAAIVLSDIIFAANVTAAIIHLFAPAVMLPFTFGQSNILIAQLLALNWALMIILYLLQITTAMATQYGQATTGQIWLALVSYFTYSQLFIVVCIRAVWSIILDKVLGRDQTKWVKTRRFNG